MNLDVNFDDFDAAPTPPMDSPRGRTVYGSAKKPTQVTQSSRGLDSLRVSQSHRSSRLSSGDADPLEALARLQSFDGHFSLDALTIVKLNTGIETVRQAFPSGVTDAIVATVLAMAFLSTKLGAAVDRDSWEGMYEKAQQYVEGALQDLDKGETVDVLLAKIAQMLT